MKAMSFGASSKSICPSTSLVQQVNALKPTASGFTFYVDKEGELLRTDAFDLLSREAAENDEFAAVLEAMKNAPDGRVVVETHRPGRQGGLHRSQGDGPLGRKHR